MRISDWSSDVCSSDLYDQGSVHVTITPTYSGCPAMETIREDIERVLTEAGFLHVAVEFVLSPAWTSDWVTPEGHGTLTAYGVAPPGPRGEHDAPVVVPQPPRWPRRSSTRTRADSSPEAPRAGKEGT